MSTEEQIAALRKSVRRLTWFCIVATTISLCFTWHVYGLTQVLFRATTGPVLEYLIREAKQNQSTEVIRRPVLLQPRGLGNIHHRPLTR